MLSQPYGHSPIMVLTSVFTHWNLIRQLTQREIASRYRGSLLGVLWAFLHPLVMLTVYTLVFRGAFGMRWGRDGESALDFGLLLFSGLIVHALFAESVQRAPSLIVNHSNYVKKVVFPLEILAWTSLGTALFHAADQCTGAHSILWSAPSCSSLDHAGPSAAIDPAGLRHHRSVLVSGLCRRVSTRHCARRVGRS